jgi:dTDP-L-rhamnose 4-epimerase
MKTLVTGGAGFIGSHLVARLVERGDEVVVVDNLQGQVHADGEPQFLEGVTFLRGNIGDVDVIDGSLEAVDQVVHLAAAVGVGQSMYEIANYVALNTFATAAFLERVVAKAAPRRLVVASSMSIYGEGEYECDIHGVIAPPPRTEAQLLARDWECRCPLCGRPLNPIGTKESKTLIPTSVYAITKRDHEELCLVTGSAYGIPTVALRFFNVYGPGQALSNPYTGVAAIFASRLLNGRPPLIFEDGLQSRDFIHVRDIVDGICLALECDAAVGMAINLGTGRPISVREVAAALIDGLGLDIETEVIGQYRVGDIRHCYADATLAEQVLGFRASVSLEDGMSELVQWLADKEADDRVDVATEELVSRGLTR